MSFSFQNKLIAPDAAVNDLFGNSVAIDSNFALIGAPGDDGELGDTASGASYTFDAITGDFLQKLFTVDTVDNNERFGEFVAIDSGSGLIGAPGLGETGAAYFVPEITSSFGQKLTPPDGQLNEFFGFSGALDNNLVLIGAPADDQLGDNSGAAHIVDISNLSGSKLTMPGGTDSDFFGISVDLDENRLLIGAPGNDNLGNNSGSVYLFDLNTGVEQQLFAPDAGANDQFGWSVALNGDLALIGAPNNNDRGATYLFDVSSGDFLQKLTANDADENDFFGYSTDLDSNLALIGAPGDDELGENSGAAYLFDVSSGDFLQKLIPPDGAAGDEFGFSVAINGNLALIGAPTDDDTGSAYVFNNSTSTPEPSTIISLGIIGLGALVSKKKLEAIA